MNNVIIPFPALKNAEDFSEYAKKRRDSETQNMLTALNDNDFDAALDFFNSSVGYGRLLRLCVKHPTVRDNQKQTAFYLDCWFLQELVKHLTPREDEEVVYITGNDCENMKMPYRICDVQLEQQSPVYAKATAKSCSDVLIDLCERGYNVQIVAHSHPGSGLAASTPSSIDINYLAKIQDAGSDAIGLIVTRDGHVRFFSVYTEYEITIKGKGVKHAAENVFKIPLA